MFAVEYSIPTHTTHPVPSLTAPAQLIGVLPPPEDPIGVPLDDGFGLPFGDDEPFDGMGGHSRL